MDASKASTIQTVVCAFDFSDTAELALQQAVRFARRHDAILVLAHVIEPIPLGPYPTPIVSGDDRDLRAIVEKHLEEKAQSLRDAHVAVEISIREGTPGPGLIALLEDRQADLVVIGTEGLTGVDRLVMGSTAEYVVRRSECPVLTVHPGDRVLANSIETVVLPTDLSLDAHRAAKTFVELFGNWERPHVILAYADRLPPYLDPFSHEELLRRGERDIMKEKIEEQMVPVVELLRAADFEVETAVLDGDPVTVITELANERKVDLILLGTHGHSALLNVLMGKTAQRIVQLAPCPVLTVRTRNRASDDD